MQKKNSKSSNQAILGAMEYPQNVKYPSYDYMRCTGTFDTQSSTDRSYWNVKVNDRFMTLELLLQKHHVPIGHPV